MISGSTWELVSSGRVLQGADSGHSAGTTIEAGLPNINGQVRVASPGQTTFAFEGVSGAFYSDNVFKPTDPLIGNLGTTIAGNRTALFDASRSSPVYGNSTTVQPPAYIVNIYRRTA